MKTLKKYMDKSKYLVGQLNITDIFSRSAGVAYYLTLSIFPSVMFLMCAFAYMPSIIGDFVEASIRTNVPAGASNILLLVVDSAINNRSLRLLEITFLIAVWTFSKAVKNLIIGQNEAYNFSETRSFIKRNLLAFLYAIALILKEVATWSRTQKILFPGVHIGNLFILVFFYYYSHPSNSVGHLFCSRS